ncbi:AAA-domain-containing protein [Basidiobolus meristosporus CBS 931.73]|uniref:AAA-domain-containing protein n=1 Tax=Basidiobolus meristosporus CBS 931.73 TaxID=1314790 RepID=A0A1Y1YSM4_9FUNG|nr:AAA-domain-containing protein [Basidiobolus meristosporus CBS 931.73]|eukprot:ORY01028.1 AAA-domain-containing protein [Basidiobolus meristosporus CBS 931.73]
MLQDVLVSSDTTVGSGVAGKSLGLQGTNELTKSLAKISISSRELPDSLPGLEQAYQGLLELVSYPLKYADKFTELGIECPKGVLLYGPPGVGKTLLVRTVSEATNAHMDSLTPNRSEAQLHESRVVAQLLTLMDGLKSRGKLVVIGATNRPNAIDPALRRPGRFDREVAIDVPSEDARLRIIEGLMRNVPVSDDVNFKTIATMTSGFVGADLSSLTREAVMHAVHRGLLETTHNPQVNMEDIQAALTQVSPSMQRGLSVDVSSTKWEDVGGLEEVKAKLKQAVEWPITYQATFERLGLRAPRGILLYGPPGCSKTTLVKVFPKQHFIPNHLLRAFAHLGASFFSVNGAALYSPFVGDSEKAIRTVFQRARAGAPSIVFFDEIEAIVGARQFQTGAGGGDSVQERVLSMLLNEMDGVESANSVLVVGATNRPDLLDAALMRPGRFDRLVYVPPPDHAARLQILTIHTQGTPLDQSVSLEEIASKTDRYTGADLKNVCREAAMIALREMRTATEVSMAHFNMAMNVVKPSLSPSTLDWYDQYNQKLAIK